MFLFSTVFSGVCLVMQDIQGSNLRDYPVISNNIGSENLRAQARLIDTCLVDLTLNPEAQFVAKAPAGQVAGMFDAIEIENGTIREFMEDSVIGIITKSFEVQGQANSEKINTKKEVKDLKDEFKNADPFPISEGPFRCDYLGIPTMTVRLKCDPATMTPNNTDGGFYNSDCIIKKNANTYQTQRGEKNFCTPAQFQAYVKSMDTGLNKVFNRLDASISENQLRITETLKQSAEKYLVAPLRKIVNGGGCKWLGSAYQGMVDGLCYRGAVGMGTVGESNVGAGVVAFYGLFIFYILWRCSVDNYNIEK